MDELDTLRRKLDRAQRANAALEKLIEDRTRDLFLANQELVDARDRALESTRAKSSFLANMSHELRTPLNAILGYSEMIVEELAAGAEDWAPASGLIGDARRIEGAGRHLLDLINGVLDLSKIEAGRLELLLEITSVRELVEDVVATMAPLAARLGNDLRVRIADDLGTLRVDVTRLKQVLINLLGNACKFTDHGQVTLEVDRIEQDERPWMRFRVTDTGIGMDADTTARLFQPFVQADASTTRKFGGTGLGLAITRHVCEALGGTVTAESVAGRGSTFTVMLPAEALPAPASQAEPALSGGIGVVLCIDDDVAVLDLLRRHLERDGWLVETARSGAEGIAVARRTRPILVTLDVMMPRMDGWTALRSFRSDPALADIPVVMVTIVDERPLGFALGASDYLCKPFTRDEIVRVVRRHARVGTGSVLVADQDPAAAEILRHALEQDGWRVVVAPNGRVALQLMDLARPAVVLTELSLPDLDGFQLIDAMRRSGTLRDIPVVVLTANDLEDAGQRRLENRAERVVRKPSGSDKGLLEQLSLVLIELAAARPVVTPLV